MSRLRTQPRCELFGVVRNDEIGARTFDGREDLRDGRPLVQPSVGRGRLHHRVFPAHVLGREGEFGELRPGLLNHVEVGKGRLHHEYVGALLDIECGLAQRFPGVGRIHLMRAAVPVFGRAFGGLAEGTVERGRILDGVG